MKVGNGRQRVGFIAPGKGDVVPSVAQRLVQTIMARCMVCSKTYSGEPCSRMRSAGLH